jgi:hypothetical protein
MCSMSVHYNTQKHKSLTKKHKQSFIINRSTLLHVSTLLGHLQGERIFIVTLRSYYIVEWQCALGCVLCTAGVNSAVPACRPGTQSSRLQKQRSTQSTAHSHSTIRCNLSVTITKNSPWRWPSRVETCRSVLRLMIKLSLCICWWFVFLYLHLYLTLCLAKYMSTIRNLITSTYIRLHNTRLTAIDTTGQWTLPPYVESSYKVC